MKPTTKAIPSTQILPKKEAMPSVKKFIDKRQLIHEIGPRVGFQKPTSGRGFMFWGFSGLKGVAFRV